MSSMQCAPATIPATSAGTFIAALAPAGPGTVTIAATNSGSWDYEHQKEINNAAYASAA